jgi:hypothetical protein
MELRQPDHQIIATEMAVKETPPPTRVQTEQVIGAHLRRCEPTA